VTNPSARAGALISPVELDAAGEALWAAVLAAWTDTAAHDRFVQHCYRTARLAAASARYRGRAAAAPEEEAIAARMQERIVFLSMQALVPTRPPSKRWAVFQSPWFVAIVLGCAAVGALLGFTLGTRR
jgi:hypothetical protein